MRGPEILIQDCNGGERAGLNDCSMRTTFEQLARRHLQRQSKGAPQKVGAANSKQWTVPPGSQGTHRAFSKIFKHGSEYPLCARYFYRRTVSRFGTGGLI